MIRMRLTSSTRRGYNPFSFLPMYSPFMGGHCYFLLLLYAFVFRFSRTISNERVRCSAGICQKNCVLWLTCSHHHNHSVIVVDQGNVTMYEGTRPPDGFLSSSGRRTRSINTFNRFFCWIVFISVMAWGLDLCEWTLVPLLYRVNQSWWWWWWCERYVETAPNVNPVHGLEKKKNEKGERKKTSPIQKPAG